MDHSSDTLVIDISSRSQMQKDRVDQWALYERDDFPYPSHWQNQQNVYNFLMLFVQATLNSSFHLHLLLL